MTGASSIIGARRLSLVRALLGGAATAALLPDLVRSFGGDAATCLRLGSLFALGTLVAELPAAWAGDRSGESRTWLRRAGVVQAIGLAGIAASRSLAMLAVAVVVVGIGAGLSTGAESRASLAIGSDARTVARLEVSALLGKGTVCCAIALLATLLGAGARGALFFSAALALIAACTAGTMRIGDRVREVPSGRRKAGAHPSGAAARDERAAHGPHPRGDRRKWLSIGVLALAVGVGALTLAARGTDALDAFVMSARGSGLFACALLLLLKGVIARTLAPLIARSRLHGVAIAALLAAIPLAMASHLPSKALFPTILLACGIAGAAAAAARGILLVRLGSVRVGIGAAMEASGRRLALALGALILAPMVRTTATATPYMLAGAVALLGAIAVLTPRVLVHMRARLTPLLPHSR